MTHLIPWFLSGYTVSWDNLWRKYSKNIMAYHGWTWLKILPSNGDQNHQTMRPLWDSLKQHHCFVPLEDGRKWPAGTGARNCEAFKRLGAQQVVLITWLDTCDKSSSKCYQTDNHGGLHTFAIESILNLSLFACGCIRWWCIMISSQRSRLQLLNWNSGVYIA